MQLAYELYSTDNVNRLMDNSVEGVSSPGAQAWIQGNVQEYQNDYTEHPSKGVLWPYNKSLGIYRCPTSRAFLQGVGRGVTVPHNRSYSVSVWLGSNLTPPDRRQGAGTVPGQLAASVRTRSQRVRAGIAAVLPRHALMICCGAPCRDSGSELLLDHRDRTQASR